jgi:hypothetical protein
MSMNAVIIRTTSFPMSVWARAAEGSVFVTEKNLPHVATWRRSGQVALERPRLR